MAYRFGEVAEWSNVPDSKSGMSKGIAGSNPALSANVKGFIRPCGNTTVLLPKSLPKTSSGVLSCAADGPLLVNNGL